MRSGTKCLPVFIIGYPRSGTTLVHHAIMSAGDFPQLGSETHFFSHFYRRYGDIAVDAQAMRLEADITDSVWWPKLGLSRQFLRDSVHGANGSYGRVFRDLMDEFAGQQDKSAWIEKTPWHMLYVKEIYSNFPDARIIVMIRDPRDVALSVMGYGWSKSYIKCLVAWKWHMQRMRNDLRDSGRKVLTIRYEDFVACPTAVFDRCSDYLGMPLEYSKLNKDGFGVLQTGNSSHGRKLSGISRDATRRWVKTLSSKDQALSNRVVGAELKRYSYELATTDPIGYGQRLKIAGVEMSYWAMKSMRHILYPIVLR